MPQVKDLLSRDPFREIESVIKITSHDPHRVWREMDEYVPTETVRQALRDILGTLLETRRGPTERACIWLSGFFGSGKSHFLKALGYLLEDRPLRDDAGNEYGSQEFLARRLGLEGYLPHLREEFRVGVFFINLLDHDPQSPERPTISRLIYKRLLEIRGLSTTFWVAAWEREIQHLGKWDAFRQWVRENRGRPWEDERKLQAESALRQALPRLFPDRFSSEEEVKRAIEDSKRQYDSVEPSDVVSALVEEAERCDPRKGRVVVLLDEVGLYIGDDVQRLTDLNSLAEQVVDRGNGRILLIVTAQEALTDLVPRLTRDRQILEWLKDRFRQHFGLLPSEVRTVIAQRLLAKTPQGADQVRQILERHEGNLRSVLCLRGDWEPEDFVQQYPCHPYAIELMQDIMGAMWGSIEEARRLSGSERSMLKLVHAILKGEGGLPRGAEKPVGWLVSLDLLFDALKSELQAIRSRQLQAIERIEQELGDVHGFPVARVAKALFLLQHVSRRYPCTVENLTSVLIDDVACDGADLQKKVQAALKKLRAAGWVAAEDGHYRLLTPEQHLIEQTIHQNLPTVAELQRGIVEQMRSILQPFNYEHGQVRRRLPVAFRIDGETVSESGDLRVVFYTPWAGADDDTLRAQSIAEPQTVFWRAAESGELRSALERALAVGKTLEQWATRSLPKDQEEYRESLRREYDLLRNTRIPELVKKAFLQGRMFIGGREWSPQPANFEQALRDALRSVAQEQFHAFIDKKPQRDEDCAAILNWRPGAALPEIYTELGLLTQTGQIHRDAQCLSLVRAELQARQQRGQERTGTALTYRFAAPPYGWDPRLVRLCLATLMKAGLVGFRYQNREVTDPTDPQARPVFTRAREFNRAEFQILPEIDWRRASELCSSLFGVPGGDTFEQTAGTVQREARRWIPIAEQLATRCRDNRLPEGFAQACTRLAEALRAIAEGDDLNTRLRRFLESADALKRLLPRVRRLENFSFDEYRKVGDFARSVQGWAQGLGEAYVHRWQNLVAGLRAEDLPERWDQIGTDFASLWMRYQADYTSRHQAFREAVTEALGELRRHEAFQRGRDEAESRLQTLEAWRCSADTPEIDPQHPACSVCRRPYEAMEPSVVRAKMQEIEEQLDALVQPPGGPPRQPLRIERRLQTSEDLKAVVRELRRYHQSVGKPLRVRIEATPEED